MSWVGGSWLGFENVFAGAGEAHVFAGYTFDGGGIALQVSYVVLQSLIFFVELVDLFLDFAGFDLRAMHRQDAVGAEDILQEQQGEAGDEQRIHVTAEKTAELFVKTFAGILSPRAGRCRFHLLRLPVFCVPLLHFVIQTRASSANFSAAAGFAASA